MDFTELLGYQGEERTGARGWCIPPSRVVENEARAKLFLHRFLGIGSHLIPALLSVRKECEREELEAEALDHVSLLLWIFSLVSLEVSSYGMEHHRLSIL